MRFRKVYLEISNICNLNCAFCPGTRRRQRFMTAEEFAAIAEKLRGAVQYLYLHVMGEPLLHPALPQILAAAEKGAISAVKRTEISSRVMRNYSFPRQASRRCLISSSVISVSSTTS